jgi:hypothetical protein
MEDKYNQYLTLREKIRSILNLQDEKYNPISESIEKFQNGTEYNRHIILQFISLILKIFVGYTNQNFRIKINIEIDFCYNLFVIGDNSEKRKILYNNLNKNQINNPLFDNLLSKVDDYFHNLEFKTSFEMVQIIQKRAVCNRLLLGIDLDDDEKETYPRVMYNYPIYKF